MIAPTAMRIASPSSDPFALPTHGGDLDLAEARFGRPPEGWLDLSTGINPFPYPLPDLPAELWHRLPSSAMEADLRRIAAGAYGVAHPDQLVTAAGSQAILQMLPRLRPFTQVAVVGPTYGEHAACWSNAGHQVVPCETLDRVAGADVVVVTNPNNPDGRCQDRERLLDLARGLGQRGGLLLVDETFVDATPDMSLAGEVAPGLLVLRSFGKFFGLAGVRLGFAIGEPALARLLRSALGPWAVSGPALAIGRQALADHGWIAESRRRLMAEAAALANEFARAGLSVVGGTALFLLVSAPRAWALYEYLGQRGILARPFAAAPRWLRFGLPGSADDRRRLGAALAGWSD